MIKQNAVRLSGAVVQDEFLKVTAAMVEDGKVVLQVGKKRHHHILVKDS
jgi:tyrosyl-tRNA synthetase